LKYLHENGCPWNNVCCEQASNNGDLEVLKYLHENGYTWNENSGTNKIEVLKYLHEYPWERCEYASENGL